MEMSDLQNILDVVILGTGPAGIQAAIHAARRKVSVLALGKENKSSLFNTRIENFCCLFNVSGEDMLSAGRKQAASFGATFSDEDVLAITPLERGFQLTTENDTSITTRALIISTGTKRNRLGVPGEKELLGKGVSYCVDCDGNFYNGEDVAVLGGESAAVDGAMTLTEIARQVHLVCDQLDVSDALKRKLEQSSVKVHTGAQVAAILGSQQVTGVRLKDDTVLPVTGLFIEQGAKGLLELATNLGIVLDDEMRFIKTDKQQATNIPGIYAAGDICGPPWQVAKAVGEGCVAGLSAAQYAKKMR
jgi:thioredoxin reductase (NADPH)